MCTVIQIVARIVRTMAANFFAFRGAPSGEDHHGFVIAPDGSNRMSLVTDQGAIIQREIAERDVVLIFVFINTTWPALSTSRLTIRFRITLTPRSRTAARSFVPNRHALRRDQHPHLFFPQAVRNATSLPIRLIPISCIPSAVWHSERLIAAPGTATVLYPCENTRLWKRQLFLRRRMILTRCITAPQFC